ncbi:MAG: TfoX/Sxy family protein [Neomegalonema sp.]|nr:TfoX/Sxy family protein [Neomegalonema sp.]
MTAKALPAYVAHLHDLMTSIMPVSASRMFGGHVFRADGTLIASVIKDQLYLRVDEALRAELKAQGSRPFTYQRSGREIIVERWYSAPEGADEDPDILRPWLERALAASLAEPE